MVFISGIENFKILKNTSPSKRKFWLYVAYKKLNQIV